jgi:hypothetical protein
VHTQPHPTPEFVYPIYEVLGKRSREFVTKGRGFDDRVSEIRMRFNTEKNHGDEGCSDF